MTRIATAKAGMFLIAVAVALCAVYSTLLLVVTLALKSHSPLLRASVEYVAGRSNGYSFRDTVRAVRYTNSVYDGRQALASRSKVLRREHDIELWSTPHGELWAPAGDRDGLFGVIFEQENDIYDQGTVSVRPGDVVLDVGAHVGLFSRVALRRGASLVIAIEPAPATIECLRRNLANEIRAGRVIVVPKGVMDQPGTMAMHVFHNWNSGMNSFAIQWEKGLPVLHLPVTTIDALVPELHLSQVHFIKMDIEGAERNALAGATTTMARFHPRMSIASYHLPDDARVIPAVARNAFPGYRWTYGMPKEWITHEIRPESIEFYD